MKGFASGSGTTGCQQTTAGHTQDHSRYTESIQKVIKVIGSGKCVEDGNGAPTIQEYNEQDVKMDSGMQDLIERLIDRLDTWLEARTNLAVKDKALSYVSPYIGEEGLTAESKTKLNLRLDAVEEARKGHDQAKLGLTEALSELLRTHTPAKDVERGVVGMMEAATCTTCEQGIQTIDSPQSSPSEEARDARILSELLQDQAKKLEEIKETERLLIEAATEKISGEVGTLLPKLVAHEIAASEARRSDAGRQSVTQPSVEDENVRAAQYESTRVLQRSVELLSQSVAEIQADQRRLHASITALADDAALHTEALQRRQSIDRELHDVLANHTVHVARHEEMLYNLTNLIGRMPKPMHSFGNTPIPGISEELTLTARAMANAASNPNQ